MFYDVCLLRYLVTEILILSAEVGGVSLGRPKISHEPMMNWLPFTHGGCPGVAVICDRGVRSIYDVIRVDTQFAGFGNHGVSLDIELAGNQKQKSRSIVS